MNFFDATAILFADPTDTTPTPDLTLDDAIDYAKWQVTVAQEHLQDLLRQKAEYDDHIDKQFQNHIEIEFGKAALISDAHDCRIREIENA